MWVTPQGSEKVAGIFLSIFIRLPSPPPVGLRALHSLEKKLHHPLKKLKNSCEVKKGIFIVESFGCQAEKSISLHYPEKSRKERKNVPTSSKIIFLAFISAL